MQQKRILTGLAIVVALFVILVAMQPEDFRITRSATMNAQPGAIFKLVNDFHKWEAWSPWAKLDPDAKNTFEGAKSGKGAIFKWDGNREVGAGTLTILESRPSQFIQMQLDFLRPFKATHMAEYTFKAEGKQTLVTWTMYGKNNFVGKIMDLVMNCDKIVGGQFDQGLAAMKAIVEKKK